MPWIELFRDGEHSAHIPLRRTDTRIGRGSVCDIVLPADYVSRVHCLVRRRGKRYQMVDQSSNGTYMDGRRVERTWLREGDRIDIGDWALVYRGEGEEQPSAVTVRRPMETAGTVLRYNPSDKTLTVDGFELIVSEGVHSGESHAIDRPLLLVGRSDLCDWRIDDSSIDPEHMEVRCEGGLLRVRDLGSRRGTRLDGRSLHGDEAVPLGSNLQLGNLNIRLQRCRREQPLPTRIGDHFHDMVGQSERMHQIFSLIDRIADQDVPVLILGETGTGKELVARAVHRASTRSEGPFIAINCGALPENLIESELFGHVKGAFTGAVNDKKGAFRAADGGTLFLDEIGELPLHLQSRLLRALENGDIVPVGSTEVYRPKVRIVAATNRDLAHESASGEFRADLFYRLFGVPIYLPPLRQRRDDIPLLISHMLAKFAPDEHIELDTEAIQLLVHQDWQGNVRSLQNTLVRAVAIRKSNHITVDDLVFPPNTRSNAESLRWPSSAAPISPEEHELSRMDRAQRRVIIEVLEEVGGSKRKASPILGIARSTLYHRCIALGID